MENSEVVLVLYRAIPNTKTTFTDAKLITNPIALVGIGRGKGAMSIEDITIDNLKLYIQ